MICMTCWLERGESRYLDLITASARGLIELSGGGRFPDKYEIFRKGFKSHDLFQGVPGVIVDSQIKNFSVLSQGRYVREMAYVLLALNLGEDLFWKRIGKIEINSFSDITSRTFTDFVQSRNSRYRPLQAALDLSRQKFGSEDWAEILRNQILSYGYFARYMDCIKVLSKALGDEPIFITQIKNLIGPYDKTVRGGGPDFIQETFKSWGFFLNILNLRTGGRLENYSEEERLQYLQKHTGFITDGRNAYRILRNLRKTRVSFNYEEAEPTRIACFMRLADLNIWRSDSNLALCSALKKLRLIYLLSSRGEVDGTDIINDRRISEIEHHYHRKSPIIEDLLFLESMGMRFSITRSDMEFNSFTEFILEKICAKNPNIMEDMKTITTKSIFLTNLMSIQSEIDVSRLAFCSERKIDTPTFEKYLFNGELLDWIREI